MHVCVPVGGVELATLHPGPTYCGDVTVPVANTVKPVIVKVVLVVLETTGVPVKVAVPAAKVWPTAGAWPVYVPPVVLVRVSAPDEVGTVEVTT